VVGLVLAAAAPPPALPAEGSAAELAIAELRDEIAALRRDYETRMAALEERLAALVPTPAVPSPVAPAPDELAELRAAALRAAAGAAPSATTETVAEPSVGRERNLNRLNPEISVTGIVVANADERREEFSAQEFELDLQSALDPFSRMRFTLAVGEEGVELEEGYIRYSSLPGGLELMAGRFRQRFGPLNRQHLHALPQAEYPLVYQTWFGDEGLGQTGVSLSWLLPRGWATANEVTLEVTDGENEVAFAGESFEDLSLLAHVKSFWDVSSAAWVEWGLSGIAGKTATGGDSRIYGTDLTLHWQPPRRAKYREITWRTELLRSRRDDPLAPRLEAWGGYTYLEGLLGRNLYAGLRYDRVEDPLDPPRRLTGFVPYLSWWQSEYVRLRAEYGQVDDSLTGERDDRFTLQLTWAAGPHKHESY